MGQIREQNRQCHHRLSGIFLCVLSLLGINLSPKVNVKHGRRFLNTCCKFRNYTTVACDFVWYSNESQYLPQLKAALGPQGPQWPQNNLKIQKEKEKEILPPKKKKEKGSHEFMDKLAQVKGKILWTLPLTMHFGMIC